MADDEAEPKQVERTGDDAVDVTPAAEKKDA